jgi:hypothetical protein
VGLSFPTDRSSFSVVIVDSLSTPLYMDDAPGPGPGVVSWPLRTGKLMSRCPFLFCLAQTFSPLLAMMCWMTYGANGSEWGRRDLQDPSLGDFRLEMFSASWGLGRRFFFRA